MVTLQESQERLLEAENETAEAGVTSWLDGDYESPLSVRYYVPSEMPNQEED